MSEIWKDVEGYEGYYKVSNKGRVKSVFRYVSIGRGRERPIKERLMNISISNAGYELVQLSKDGETKGLSVHRLVAKSFVDNPDNKLCVNHKDGNKTNNHVDNLEWVTYSENNQHGIDNDLSKNKGHTHYLSSLSKNDVLDIRNAYRLGCFTKREISKAYPCSESTIGRIINKQTYTNI